MRTFDFYEFAGIVTPGVLVLVGLDYIAPSLLQNGFTGNLSLGASGILIVLAYAAGHLIQVIGNVLEFAYWGVLHGRPTDWIYGNSARLLSPHDIKLVKDAVRQDFLDRDGNSKISRLQALVVTRRIYALVASGGRTSRIDTFNANYGLCRGIGAAFAVLLMVCLAAKGISGWRSDLALLLLFVIALQSNAPLRCALRT